MKYIIIGNSDYAKLLYSYVKHEKEVIAFSVDADYIDKTSLFDIPVVSYEDIDMLYSPSSVELLMAVGYSEMNDIREKLYRQYCKKGYTFGTYVHPSVIIGDECLVGKGNVFFEGVIIENGCQIGDLNAFFFGTVVGHDSIIGDFNSFSRSSIAGRVKVGNNCFLGMGSVVNSDVTIGSHVLIGAATYVTTNISDGRATVAEKSRVIDRDISRRIV